MATSPPRMATCTTQQWTFNSQNQSPCVVGSALAGACVGGEFTLVDLDPGFVYLGPTAAAATPCRCSTVYYQLLSACALCQGEQWLRWGGYSASCDTVYVGVFPRPLPAGLAVPTWAYLDIEDEDNFNATSARAIAAAGEETTGASTSTTPRVTSGTNTGSPSGTGTGSTPQQSNDPGAEGQSSKSNAGAIAGGVVGGVVGLLLIAGLVFWFMRRRNRERQAPAALYSRAPLDNVASPPTSPTSPPPQMSYADGSSNQQHTGNSNGNGTPQPQVYNPDDPMTYPSTNEPPPMSYGPSGASVPIYPNTGQPNYSQDYSGAPGPTASFMPPHMTGHSASSGYTQANTSITTNTNARYTGVPEL